MNGFSLHADANTSTDTLVRDSLRKLLEYTSRGPLANKRLEISKSEQVKLKLKTAYGDGGSHLLFSPREFIEKLSAIIPPRKKNLVKWSGIFAPNSPCRSRIVLKPGEKKGQQVKGGCTDDSPIKKSRWSKMMAKVFQVHVAHCQHGKGETSLVAAVNCSCDHQT